jgi:NADH:ubiquinone oxidoreductase subunit F (NADH-binding)
VIEGLVPCQLNSGGGEPTVVNNVETPYNVLEILALGVPRFAEIGAGRSTGTRLFASPARLLCPVGTRWPMG